jgi:hypothetical protein
MAAGKAILGSIKAVAAGCPTIPHGERRTTVLRVWSLETWTTVVRREKAVGDAS